MVSGSTRKLFYGFIRGMSSQCIFAGRQSPRVRGSSEATSSSPSSSSSSSWLPLMAMSLGVSERRRWSSTQSLPPPPPPPLRTFTRNVLTIHSEKPSIDSEETQRRQLTDLTILSPEQVTKISLRSAKPDDCGDIMKLLRNFAELEDSLDMLEITEEDLLRDGFGETPFYRCVVAEAQGLDDTTSLVAYSMFNFIYCAWKGRMVTIEDIFVHHAYRGFGLGAIILHQVSRHAYNLGCRRVTGYVDNNDANLPRWYQSYGFIDFTRQFDYHIYSLSDAPLDKFVKEYDPFTKPNALGMDINSSL